jgi:tRNA G46 methylase TrmB
MDNNYNYYYNSGDSSGRGCLTEIVYNNEYNLDKFKNIKGTIIDIGGNSGVATIILAKQNPDSKIYSYEPDHNLYLNIIKNVQINNLNNVYVFNIVVSDKNGVCQLSKFPSMTCANTIYANNKFIDYTRNTAM